MEDTFLDMLATQDGDKSLLGLITALISRAKEQTQFQQPDQPSIPSSSTSKASQPEEDFISPTVGRTASSAIGGSNQFQKNLTLDQPLSDRDLFLLSTIANTLRSKMREIRRHFHTATRLNKYHSHSWVAWAHFERKLGSSGRPRTFDTIYCIFLLFVPSDSLPVIVCTMVDLLRVMHEVSFIALLRVCYSLCITIVSYTKSIPLLSRFFFLSCLCHFSPFPPYGQMTSTNNQFNVCV